MSAYKAKPIGPRRERYGGHFGPTCPHCEVLAGEKHLAGCPWFAEDPPKAAPSQAKAPAVTIGRALRHDRQREEDK